MNEEVIADLKQFIAATVSQQMSGVATKEDIARLEGEVTGIKDEITGVKGNLARVEHKVDDLQEAVAEALSNTNDAIQEQLSEHVRQYHVASA
jgi:predicted  nucleic acid-binding Zn-ribbon protein